MRLKEGVRLTNVQPEIAIALQVCDSIYGAHAEFQDWTGDPRLDYDMVVTSVNDGSHGANSWHYQGRAFDLRVHNVVNAAELYRIIKAELGKDFDVLLEGTGTTNAHIHVEYDPR